MPKDAIVQVRVDAETKAAAEELYHRMGISLSEAVRMFVAQSLMEMRMPFHPRCHVKKGACLAYGSLRLYRNRDLQGEERDAWIRSLSAKIARRRAATAGNEDAPEGAGRP